MTRKRKLMSEVSVHNFWPSFTDMISTVVLVMFFLFFIIYLRNLIMARELLNSRKEVEAAQTNIILLKEEIEETEKTLSQKKRKLRLAEDKLDDQQLIIDENTTELKELREKLTGIAVFRVDVLKNVKKALEKELGGTNASVYLKDNGNIVLSEKLVFATGSSEIKEDGKKLLKSLAIAFEKILNDPKVRNNIDAINIQGHADETGDVQSNRILSTKRASNVVNYLMEANKTLENKYGRYFAASGYSEFRPIDEGKTKEALAKNRRIEISLILRDPNIVKLINQYLTTTKELE